MHPGANRRARNYSRWWNPNMPKPAGKFAGSAAGRDWHFAHYMIKDV
jgi:hypothetical protein